MRLEGESAFCRPSSWEMVPSRIMRNRHCSKVCDPGAIDLSMASFIALISPFSISSAMWRVLSITSTAAERPPARLRISRCETMHLSAAERSCSSAGRFSSG